jgi:hypothetical protein
MRELVSAELRPAINNHTAHHGAPALKPVEVAVHLCIDNAPAWVLVERVPYNPKVQSSPLYIALRRRGFDVSYRSNRGVKNVWARWPHAAPHLDIQEFGGELDEGSYGEMDDEDQEAAVS